MALVGVGYAQGFHLGRPAPLDALASFEIPEQLSPLKQLTSQLEESPAPGVMPSSSD